MVRAERKISRASSSMERPWWAARILSRLFVFSSSFLIVRVAMLAMIALLAAGQQEFRLWERLRSVVCRMSHFFEKCRVKHQRWNHNQAPSHLSQGKIMRSASIVMVVAFFLTLHPATVASSTWYVNGVNGNDRNNCKSPETPCKTIVHAISLASSGDSIEVASATYIENLTIALSLNIVGHGASTTIIDGGQHASVVTISSSGANVTVAHVTIRNGKAKDGGGINNSGTLTVSSSVLSGNMASLTSCQSYPCIAEGGAIDNTGTLTVNNSNIHGNKATEQGAALGSAVGGGIHNFGGKVVINNTTLSGNTASFAQCQTRCLAEGGAVYNDGTLILNNSTVSGNSTFSDRGAGTGGGIINLGSAAINNSTLAGNSAPSAAGGVENPEGSTLRISNSTLSGNSAADGGSIGSYMSTVILQNSIVANSPSGGNCSGTMTSKGYNLSSDATCDFKGPGDMNDINPLLGLLQNNGGPTQTMSLLDGSPAIDAGNPAGCTDNQGHLLTTDQRGMPRPDKEDTTGCDVGAYERQMD